MTLLAERVQTSSKSHFSASLPAGARAQQQHWAAHGRGRATSTHQAWTKHAPSVSKQPQHLSGTCPPGYWCLKAHRGVCAPSMWLHFCPHTTKTESFPCPHTHPYPRERMCYHTEKPGCLPAKPSPQRFASVVPCCSPLTALGILCFSRTFPFLSLLPFFLPAKTPCHGCLLAPINLLHGLKWCH